MARARWVAVVVLASAVLGCGGAAETSAPSPTESDALFASKAAACRDLIPRAIPTPRTLAYGDEYMLGVSDQGGAAVVAEESATAIDNRFHFLDDTGGQLRDLTLAGGAEWHASSAWAFASGFLLAGMGEDGSATYTVYDHSGAETTQQVLRHGYEPVSIFPGANTVFVVRGSASGTAVTLSTLDTSLRPRATTALPPTTAGLGLGINDRDDALWVWRDGGAHGLRPSFHVRWYDAGARPISHEGRIDLPEGTEWAHFTALADGALLVSTGGVYAPGHSLLFADRSAVGTAAPQWMVGASFWTPLFPGPTPIRGGRGYAGWDVRCIGVSIMAKDGTRCGCILQQENVTPFAIGRDGSVFVHHGGSTPDDSHTEWYPGLLK